MQNNINRVVLSGNLTADPELRSLPSGTSVCNLRLACNGRRKNGKSGEWEDKPNYFNIVVWGKGGENVARYLTKGSPVAIDGRLDWREWEASEGGKRQAVDVVAEFVQFLPDGKDRPENANGSESVPAGVAAGAQGEDDIPF